jgi:hypothetical protein
MTTQKIYAAVNIIIIIIIITFDFLDNIASNDRMSNKQAQLRPMYKEMSWV